MIMQDNAASREESFYLGQYELPRLFNGLWQLSSNSWGSAPAAKIRRQMATYAENGYTAFGELHYAFASTHAHSLTSQIW